MRFNFCSPSRHDAKAIPIRHSLAAPHAVRRADRIGQSVASLASGNYDILE